MRLIPGWLKRLCTVPDPIDPVIDQPITEFETRRDIDPIGVGLVNFHSSMLRYQRCMQCQYYSGMYLVCALHPAGPEVDQCPDFEAKCDR